MSFLAQHTDHELFRLIAGDEEAAFAELFRRYDRRIYPFVLKMIRTEALAEDITHEIFIKIWKHREKLSGIDQPEAYILTIAARHTLDHIKKRLNENKMLQGLSASKEVSHNDTEDQLLGRDRAALIQQAVNQLPPQQRTVYELSRLEGMNYEQIAQQLNISPHTVRNHLVKALRFLRDYLKEQDELPAALLACALLFIKK
ncbi:MAG TPA: RNA polymerase sigma-70 factor [Puia sp.]|nr:RNA polymerase sigma-70 factor [Puia sp.]